MSVLACGLATLDVVQTVDHVPAADEKVEATDLAVAAGGPAANAAATAVGLGVPARLLTRVGHGPLAEAVRADLATAGVDVVDVAGPEETPPLSTVLVTRTTGERAVVSVNARGRPAGEDGPTTPPAARVDAVVTALEGARVLLVDGHHLDLALTAARRARQVGVPVVLDGGSWKPGLELLLPLVDVALLSADFRLPGHLTRSVAAAGADDVLAGTRRAGARAAGRSAGGGPLTALAADGAPVTVPVRPVTVVDTLGAGDVLHGALAAWVDTHQEDPATAPALARALAVAAEVASTSCAFPGARGWVGDPQERRRLADLLAAG